MNITDRKIVEAIERNLPNGKFVIFPYGKWGKRVKYILNKKYKIKEIAIIDNELSKKDDNILNIHEIQDISCEDYVVLFAVSNPEAYEALLGELHYFCKNSVCDISLLEVSPFFSMCNDKMYIEECDNTQLKTIFNLTKQTWSQLGAEEPYWSVLTSKNFLVENMDEKRKEEFYESGRKGCQSIIKTLIRNDVIKNPSEAKRMDIIEIGCGTGRVTKHLAEAFGKVTAVDVSAGNMKIASAMVKDSNVSFCLYNSIEDYMNLPRTDVIYSIIVLQHNAPPVMEYILNAMLKSLRAGGVAFFQIPTYREFYEFRYEEYIHNVKIGKMEMHPFPQRKIFETAYINGCIPLEVYQDELCAPENFSCTFVVKKINDSSDGKTDSEYGA